MLIVAREVYVYRTDSARVLRENDILETPLLPGFSIRVADLFDRAIDF